MNAYSDSEHSEAEQIWDETEEVAPEGDVEDDGEELIHEDMEADYLRNPEEDQYDPTMIDDTETGGISAEAQRRAEAAMRARDNEERDARGGPRAGYEALYELLQNVEEDAAEVAGEGAAQRRITRHRRIQDGLSSQLTPPSPQDVATAKEELPYHVRGRPWDNRLEEIFKVLFQDFILNFTDVEDDSGLYFYKLVQVIRAEKRTLPIKFDHLVNYLPKLGEWIVNHPIEMFGLVSSVIMGHIVWKLYPRLYRDVGIEGRLIGFGDFVEPISNLKQESLNQLVACEGVVLRRGAVYAKVKELYIECVKCGEVIGPMDMHEDAFKTVRQKTICPREGCSSDGPFFMNREKMKHKSMQILCIQELSNAVLPGRIPRQKEVSVDGDLVDMVRPGDEIQVVGFHQHKRVAELNAKVGFPVVEGHLIANNIVKKTELKKSEISDEDINLFKRLSQCSNIRDRIITSIAPSIWGHRHAKTAIAMSMFGGVRKEGTEANKHSIRGDINVLLLGDPGMAKSQFLKYVNGVVDKSVFTTGKGASATGLTASMKKDPTTGEYSLEGGALVLADNGICLIDEFDKMSEHDRVSIHEAMECQTISISKAGICTSLRARCSVIAAANPIYGRYDTSLSFAENVTLGDTILSRFDVLAVMRDVPTVVYDEYLASYVLGMHRGSHPDVLLEKQFGLDEAAMEDNLDHADILSSNKPLPQSLLTKYICYAKQNYHPIIQKSDQAKVAEFYAQVRQASKTSGGLSLTVRHLESILRMSLANAKMRLSHVVERSDIDFAISTLLESFIQSQKHAVATSLSKRFGRYRALACHPYELLESLLGDVLNKKMKSDLADMLNREGRTDLGFTDMDVMMDKGVTVNVLTCLAKSLYGITESFVDKYLATDRFKVKFTLRTTDEGPSIFTKIEDDDEDVRIDFLPQGGDTQEASTQVAAGMTQEVVS